MPYWDSQTFGLDRPRDVLEKLRWEVDELAATERHRLDLMAYRSLNCATTAWHMCDWLFAECQAKRDAMERLSKLSCMPSGGALTLGAVQRWALQERPIAICRQIATAGKHVRVTKYPDPTVKAQYEVTRQGLPKRDEDGWWKLVIYDGEEIHRPHHVFARAHLFWKLALSWVEL